jgi:hypothetical protein
MKKSWRQLLPVHPAAELFPMMSEEELRALGKDIGTNGLQSPIAIFRKNVSGRCEYALLDGRNRLDAMEAVGVEFGISCKKGYCYFTTPVIMPYDFPDFPDPIMVDTDPYAFVLSANAHRRHLTLEQKRELIEKVLKMAPQKSDRQVSEAVKVSPSTVGAIRKSLEKVGDVSKLDTRTDTKGRQQRAHKAPRAADELDKEEAPSAAWQHQDEELQPAPAGDTEAKTWHDDLEQITAEQRGGATDAEWALAQQTKPAAAKRLLLDVIRERNELREEIERLQAMLNAKGEDDVPPAYMIKH